MIDITENLEHYYRACIENDLPWHFFNGLGNYMLYVLATPQLKKVVDREFAKRTSEYDEVRKLENRSLAEMRAAKQKLLDIIKDNDVDVKMFKLGISSILTSPGKDQTAIQQMEMFENGQISGNGFHSDYLKLFLFDIAANLLELGYRNELNEFIFPSHEYAEYYVPVNGKIIDSSMILVGNTHGNFIFSKTWPARFRKVEAVDLASRIEPWGSFDMMLKFWKARSELAKNAGPDEVIADCMNDKDYPYYDKDAVNVYYAANDLKNLANNHETKDMDLKYLHAEEMRARVSTVQLQLIQSIATKSQVHQSTSSAVTRAFERKRDQFWREGVNGFMAEVSAFMDEYRQEKQKKETEQQDELGGRWWKTGSQPSYDKINRKIRLEDRYCEIPSKAYNQMRLCEKLFPPSRFLGEPLPEYEILSLLYKDKKGKQSPRAFYDTVGAVNRLIEEKLKVVGMIKYQANPCLVRINKELFT